jgi:ABC-type multidrug transport system fused ATPase/permease subunit
VTRGRFDSSLREEFVGRTVITIAHRIQSIIDYDTVVVMDQGKVVEKGKPLELLKDSKGWFYRLARDV